MPSDLLVELSSRIERLATDPDSVSAPFTRLVRPIIRLLGYRASYEVEYLGELLAALARAVETAPPTAEKLARLLEKAIDELEDNIRSAERACVVNRSLPLSHAAWLFRVWEALARAERAARDTEQWTTLRLAAAVEPATVLPPLAIALEEDESSEAPDEGAGNAALAPDDAADQIETEPTAVRLVELQLAAIDHVMAAARAETDLLGRRRRLLEAARRLLLDASAAMPLDADGVRSRQQHLVEQIMRVDRLQALGVKPEVGVLHQARSALSRGDRQQLHAALAALEEHALTAGDGRVASRAASALASLREGHEQGSEEARRASLSRSAQEAFGEDVIFTLSLAYRRGRVELERKKQADEAADDRGTYRLALQYLAPGGLDATSTALLAVDGCFDVGAPLCPIRVTEPVTRVRAVRFPTQDMMLVPARTAEDLPAALVTDPRAVLLDLAAGRLLTRRFVRYEQLEREHTRLVGEVRIYLLDGSTSMLTGGRVHARARMRDAVLLAELATMLRRFERPDRYRRIVLLYRYFTKRIRPVQQVDSAAEAMAAMGSVVQNPIRGGTDIERALLSSFRLIRDAKDTDPVLAHAQIVLVTDGKARVRESVVRTAREQAGDVPIGVSVIALGEENETLRALVAHQRAQGERAFYHFLDDETLARICEGQLASTAALHLLGDTKGQSPQETMATLHDSLSETLDALSDLDRQRHALDLQGELDDPAERQAREELGLPARPATEGERALREAARRDRRAVRLRYDRWFPEPAATDRADDAIDDAQEAAAAAVLAAPGGEELGEEGLDQGDVDAVVVVLATVAEVVGELGGSTLGRRADAIDILERLLPDAQLSPARYHATARCYPEAVGDALTAVHLATGVMDPAPDGGAR